MKKKKKIIISFLFFIIIVAIIIICINVINNEKRLTVLERQWLDDNKNNVININVINDLNVFGKDGTGVYFDFLSSLSEKYNIQINPVPFTENDTVSGISFGVSLTTENFTSFYEDEFVLVSKEEKIINSINDIKNNKIGVTSKFKNFITSYFEKQNIEYIEYSTKEEIVNNFLENQDVNYIVVPKIMYLEEILNNDLHIVYNFSDANIYYGFYNNEENLSEILRKYFITWNEEKFVESLNSNELNLFTTSLNILSTEMDELRANSYTYGFINNGPYEILSGGNFGGINAASLKKFADLVDIKIDFIKYSNLEKLNNAIIDKKVNMYFDYYNITSDYESVSSNLTIPLIIAVSHDNSEAINSLTSLNNKEIYVEANTKIHTYLKNNTKFKLQTYTTEKELKKIVKNKGIIAIDSNKFATYENTILNDYSIRYQENISSYYQFKINSNTTFTKLLSNYLEILDNNQMRYLGLNNYYVTRKSGTLLGTLAKYILLLLGIFIVVSLALYRKSKKIKIAKKIKKEDKMRFIDQLTSLKNRNYLTENIESWNNNTIYPQAVIVLDLNKLQDINDTLGYEQGDVQIKAAANILIKTQLDNTDIIRTDGNEFLIYLVGYEVRQITSYIHKLNKEFKKLPFDYGVAIGYSMITDDVKSVEDATNEAVEQVKIQKEEKKNEQDE